MRGVDLCADGDGADGDAAREPDICWFCKRGRHEDCMGEIPTDARSEGPHDCSFDTKVTVCRCGHGPAAAST